MRKTLQDQYLLIKEGKGHKDVFIKEAKRQFPGLIRNSATYTEVANVLKTKNIINENVVGLEPINQLQPSKKESFEVAFENFLAEAKKEYFDDEKAEVKKPSKQVEEDAEKNFDYEDKKNPDNLIFDQIMKGYYTEMKDPKNENKTMEQLKAIVIKNLEKNPIYYTEKGQFGVKDLGYTTDVPGLGEPKEPKGKYKSSGYGNLNESINEDNYFNFKTLSTDPNDENKPNFKPSIDSEEEENEIITALKSLADGAPALAQLVGQLSNKIKGISKRKNESINEETQIRKVVRSIINEELEEAVDSEKDERYFIKNKKRKNTSHLPGFHKPALGEDELEEGYEDMNTMGTYQVPAARHNKNPQDIETYLNAIKGMNKVEAIEHLGEEGLSSSMVMRVLNKADRMGMFDVQDMFDVNPTVRGDVFEDDKDKEDGFDEVWDRFKKDLRKRMGQPEPPKNESLNESKIRKVIRESVESELAEINKLAEYEVYESKLEKIEELIEKKCSRLNRLDEDEDLKALTDKKKVKELQRDIKKLEKAKAKLEKALAKKAKAAPKKKEVIDEDEPLEEAELNEAPPTQDLEAGLKTAQDMKKELEDMAKIELEEDDIEAPADYLEAKDDAEGRYEAGEELDSILSDYPKYRETLERDILGKFDGMDY